MKYVLLLVFAGTWLFSGCKKDSPAPARITEPVSDMRIRIRMVEELDSTQRLLKFFCSTDKEYPCSNYSISRTVTLTPGVIDIYFQEVVMPDFCQTSIGPATTTIPLGELADGIYQLHFVITDMVVAGTLTVTAGSYTVSLVPQDLVQFLNSPLNKLPENTIFGHIGYHSPATGPLVQTFIDSLQLLGAALPAFQPGNYTPFQIGANGQIAAPHYHGYHYLRPYLFHYTGFGAELKKLVRNYGRDYGSDLQIILYTSKGERFMSWVQ